MLRSPKPPLKARPAEAEAALVDGNVSITLPDSSDTSSIGRRLHERASCPVFLGLPVRLARPPSIGGSASKSLSGPPGRRFLLAGRRCRQIAQNQLVDGVTSRPTHSMCATHGHVSQQIRSPPSLQLMHKSSCALSLLGVLSPRLSKRWSILSNSSSSPISSCSSSTDCTVVAASPIHFTSSVCSLGRDTKASIAYKGGVSKLTEVRPYFIRAGSLLGSKRPSCPLSLSRGTGKCGAIGKFSSASSTPHCRQTLSNARAAATSSR